MRTSLFSLMQWPDDRSQVDVYRAEIAQAVAAERLGYDGFWFAEHHFSRYGIQPSLHLTIAHVAALTSRIRLGTAVSVVPLYHPLRLAAELAMLDVLSGGRLDWGAGRGYQRHEFDAFGVDLASSRERFQAALEIVRTAWSDAPVRHDGRFWTVAEEVDVLPKPLQPGGPPIFVAAISPESVVWAAENGLSFVADQFASFERLREARATFDETIRAGGGDPGTYRTPVLRQIFVGETTEQARELAAPALLWYYRALAAVGSPAGRRGEAMPSGYEGYARFFDLVGLADAKPEEFIERILEQVAICGDADSVAERVAELQRFGYDEMICWMNFGDLQPEETEASMERFAERVRPQLGAPTAVA
jgi:alkanesulfonate monooxygenase SsuD/methylene tetrahydromethanopterin reductase-like flavin-dependent oxidoreductase (luciferase family)